MAWINLVSERPTRRALLERDELPDGYEDFSELVPVLRHAALADQRDRLKTNVGGAADYLRKATAALKAGRMKYTSWIRYGEIATCAILGHYAGCDDANLLSVVLATKPLKDPKSKALHHLLAVGSGTSRAGDGLSAPGHDDEALAAWPKMIAKATSAQVVDLALCPDHPRWIELQHFAAPAVFAALGPDADPDEAFRMLAWAGRKDSGEGLLHVRQAAPPGPDPEAAGNDPKWAQGLDAIEKSGDGELLCHYNMSMRHWAPWACQDDLDAFWFLKWFDADWQAAVAASPMIKASAKAKAKIVIHYDPANSVTAKAGVARAEVKYGRGISMVDFTAA
jgi:hypothetical protein